MTGAASRAGPHQSRATRHREIPFCNLTVFARCRVLAHVGTVNGRDTLSVDDFCSQ